MICLWNTALPWIAITYRDSIIPVTPFALCFPINNMTAQNASKVSNFHANFLNIVCLQDAVLIFWLIEGQQQISFRLSTILVLDIIRLLAKNSFYVFTLETGNDDRCYNSLSPGRIQKILENVVWNVFAFSDCFIHSNKMKCGNCLRISLQK